MLSNEMLSLPLYVLPLISLNLITSRDEDGHCVLCQFIQFNCLWFFLPLHLRARSLWFDLCWGGELRAGPGGGERYHWSVYCLQTDLPRYLAAASPAVPSGLVTNTQLVPPSDLTWGRLVLRRVNIATLAHRSAVVRPTRRSVWSAVEEPGRDTMLTRSVF